ncbi:MAG: DUF853 family protein [Lachnospiraceae bacterium]|nr:DUF853 family protein [Clostridiales bacterium]MBP3755020.1 DUF853 family protein [Lachnospiraceae bacterium]
MYDKQSGTIFLGKSGDKKICIYPKMANRHGMICGATGTGKTITLKVLAESFSDMGVPVFLADVKGDLAGFCRPGVDSEDMQARIERFGLKDEGFKYDSYPTNFWDVYAEKGMPLRTTVSEMGPLLLSRILELNDTQSNVLAMIFKIADDNNMLLIDTKDLKAMLNYVADHAKEYAADYGSIARQSVNAIIRSLVNLESQGGEFFFGEPALDINDWLRRDSDKGPIQVLDCQKLINHPDMYATFLLWMMSELFESLPEVGDLEKPKMVFFFDEAHLLFDNAPKALMTRIEQVVKLIRSKGVGIFFVTQSPADIPDPVLAQLGNKIEHALHAYTPAEQKKAKAAAQSFVVNPDFDTYETLLSLGTGEALVSVLDEKGVPTMVENTKILPPCSLMGSIDDATRDSVIRGSGLFSRYSDYFDRDSAYEFLQRNRTLVEGEAPADQITEEAPKQGAKPKVDKNSLSYKTTKAAQNVAKTGAGTVGREVGKTVGNAIGGKFGKTLGGNIGSSIGRNFLGVFFKT